MPWSSMTSWTTPTSSATARPYYSHAPEMPVEGSASSSKLAMTVPHPSVSRYVPDTLQHLDPNPHTSVHLPRMPQSPLRPSSGSFPEHLVPYPDGEQPCGREVQGFLP
ncbi:hypothetical protein OH77DRAFT_1416282 [Trametes cingulata]|nr:hypothetical protein OH77DRAFT_1416282 [Trametes cingulata]